MWQQLRSRFSDDSTVLPLSILILVCIIGFIVLGGLILSEAVLGIDKQIMHFLLHPEDPSKAIISPGLKTTMVDVTAMGSSFVLTFVVIMFGGYLLLAKKYRQVGFLLFVAIGGGFLNSFLKYLYDRPRPDRILNFVEVSTKSFPSGHTMSATVIYLTVGLMLGALVGNRKYKIYFVIMATVLAVLVGLSRIFLGVHYPSDVLGGWLAGVAWALLWWLIGKNLVTQSSSEA